MLTVEGSFNTRDLGGLQKLDGQVTARRRLVRSDTPDHLTSRDWETLLAYGIRTIIDLRNEDERTEDRCARPAEFTTLHIPLDGPLFADMARPGFSWEGWGPDRQLGTPLYYRAHLQRYPAASAAVLTAIADAPAGGVLFHCVSGRDRTGMIAMLVLTLAGVSAQVIADDYQLSAANLPPLFARRGVPYDGPRIDALLAKEGTTLRQSIHETLQAFDIPVHLGLQISTVEAIARRLA
ncbi:MAG TPA: tyrosine-protein phosphatase [Candidatus Xenobia bacterium]